MRTRERLPQELLHQKLDMLVPGGVLSVRPHDAENDNSHLVSNPVVLGGMLIDWDISKGAMPTREQINAVTLEQIAAKEEVERKAERNERYSKNLAMIAIYNMEKKSIPDLVFGDYLDQLEQSRLQ